MTIILREPQTPSQKLYDQILAAKLPEPVCAMTGKEWQPLSDRKWRFDFAWPKRMIALEVEGGVYQERGRHLSITGVAADAIKYNSVTVLGWRLFRVTPAQINSGYAIGLLEIVLNYEAGDARIPALLNALNEIGKTKRSRWTAHVKKLTAQARARRF